MTRADDDLLETAIAHASMTLNLVVRSVRSVAADVISLELADPDGAPLPDWSPGAHLDLRLPSGLVRSYSLHGDPDERDVYRVAVQRAADGRGGSVELHRVAAPGLALTVTGPRNAFALEPAAHYLFLAGGIGVTPLLPMLRAVARSGRPWTFVYGARSRDAMAFTEELVAVAGGELRLVPQDETGLPDFVAEFASLPEQAAAYCCGPTPMLDAVLAAGARIRPDVPIRLERFAAPADNVSRTDDSAFDVVLARSGITVTVPPGTSILDAVRVAIPDVMSSCEQGICSACETPVLDGVPDHRDSVLTPKERAANNYMMICVSRACTPRLTLDL